LPAGPQAGDRDGDGIPNNADIDRDGDGFKNIDDNCPNRPGSIGGCPTPGPPDPQPTDPAADGP
jgi:hypothetical protein